MLIGRRNFKTLALARLTPCIWLVRNARKSTCFSPLMTDCSAALGAAEEPRLWSRPAGLLHYSAPGFFPSRIPQGLLNLLAHRILRTGFPASLHCTQLDL